MPSTFDAVIVGAGVIRLSLADDWQNRRPADCALVLEKESKVALYASGCNSGLLLLPRLLEGAFDQARE